MASYVGSALQGMGTGAAAGSAAAPALTNASAADEITALAPGAGPPANRIPTRRMLFFSSTIANFLFSK